MPRGASAARATSAPRSSGHKSKSSAKSPTKSEIFSSIAGKTGLPKKQIDEVFEALAAEASRALRGAGVFTIPGLVKLKRVRKEAKPAREGRNPFTGDMMMFKAKPASNSVKASPVKQLKDMV